MGGSAPANFAVVVACALASAVAAAFEAGPSVGWTSEARRGRESIVGWSVGINYRAAIEGRALLPNIGWVESPMPVPVEELIPVLAK